VGLEGSEWRKLGDVGVFGVGLDEEHGGAGCGARAEILVAEAFGYNLAPVSVLGSMLGAHVLADTGAHAELLAGVVDGTTRVAFGAAGGSVGGGECYLLDATGADMVTVVRDDQVSLFDVSALPPQGERQSVDDGVEITAVEALGAPLAESSAPATGIRTLLLVAAMAVGVSGAARDRAVEYAKQRHQYGKPIGSFQAVKHRCVDMAIRFDAAQSLVRLTAARVDAGDVDEMATRSAVAIACEAAQLNAASAIQVFGGIGFTAEGGIHHLLRRAWVLDRLVGGSASHFDALVDVCRAAGGS
jgi:alkylation response protein AidB-like acyl-CoA dehydrogenase